MTNHIYQTLAGIVTFKAGYTENLVKSWSEERLYRELIKLKKEATLRNDDNLKDAVDRYQDLMLNRST